jgi:hypothetical protein
LAFNYLKQSNKLTNKEGSKQPSNQATTYQPRLTMTKNTQSHVGETSAFILPSPSRNKQVEGDEQQQSPDNKSTTAPLHAKATSGSYEELPSTENNRSPSLPWLVEYWSSSLCRAPEMVFDNLCSCHSAADPFETIHRSSSTESKKSYFDDTILRSDPKVDRSPTKISSTRWEALRAVVASQGDFTAQDYCDFYEKCVETMPSIEETKEDLTRMDTADSIYPTKEDKNKTRSLMDYSKDDEDEEMEIVDDEIRQAPSNSSSSDQDLQTCQSFDHYIVEPSRRYFCAPPSTPPRSGIAAPLSPPTTRLPERRRNRQANQIAPTTLGFLGLPSGQRLTPPSPAHSAAADTYTTISLSQSFAKEFDEDEDDFEPMGGNLFLDRLAAETISQSPSRCPFRRLRPRTCHEDEKKEEEETDRPSTPTRNRSIEDKDDEQYRCLVRMSPDNYKHGKTTEQDWCEFPEPGETSSVSSSVLLPLHPHQRISIEPSENSGYSFFRDQKQIAVP